MDTLAGVLICLLLLGGLIYIERVKINPLVKRLNKEGQSQFWNWTIAFMVLLFILGMVLGEFRALRL